MCVYSTYLWSKLPSPCNIVISVHRYSKLHGGHKGISLVVRISCSTSATIHMPFLKPLHGWRLGWWISSHFQLILHTRTGKSNSFFKSIFPLYLQQNCLGMRLWGFEVSLYNYLYATPAVTWQATYKFLTWHHVPGMHHVSGRCVTCCKFWKCMPLFVLVLS